MAATSSGHRRFTVPDDDDGDKKDVELKGTFAPTPPFNFIHVKNFLFCQC